MSDNNINCVEDIDKKKSTYFAESQKRYGAKCVNIAVKYTPNESDVSCIFLDAVEKSGLTKNQWVKSAIVEKLQRDGFLPVGNVEK